MCVDRYLRARKRLLAEAMIECRGTCRPSVHRARALAMCSGRPKPPRAGQLRHPTFRCLSKRQGGCPALNRRGRGRSLCFCKRLQQAADRTIAARLYRREIMMREPQVVGADLLSGEIVEPVVPRSFLGDPKRHAVSARGAILEDPWAIEAIGHLVLQFHPATSRSGVFRTKSSQGHCTAERSNSDKLMLACRSSCASLREKRRDRRQAGPGLQGAI